MDCYMLNLFGILNEIYMPSFIHEIAKNSLQIAKYI